MNSIEKIQRELDVGKLEFGDTPTRPIEKSKERVMEIETKKKMLEKELGYLNTQIRSYSDGIHEHPTPAPQMSR